MDFCLPRFIWLQPLLSAQPAKIEVNSELLIWHNSPEESVHWTTCINGKGSECSHWNRHAVYGFTIPACNSSAKTTVGIFFPSWYSTQHCFWPRDSFSRNESGDGLMQWKSVGHPHCDGETGILVSNCIHGFQFIFAGLFILVASFALKSFPRAPYFPVYPHRFQFGPPLLPLCPSFLPGSDLDDFMPDRRCKSNSLT